MDNDPNRSNIIKAVLLSVSVTAACFSVVLMDVCKKAKNNNNGHSTIIINELPSSTASSSSTKLKPPSATSAVPITTEEVLYIDINSAPKEELTKLKGVGEVIADSIIAYRNEHGGFRNIEEIMNVSGIGESVFTDIKDFIYVVEPVYETTSATKVTTTTTTKAVTTTVPETEPPTETTAEPVTEHVPTLEEIAPINLNTAGVDELALLPHMNEELALELIDIRERIGGFSHVYEILLLDKLTQPQCAEILPYIYVE